MYQSFADQLDQGLHGIASVTQKTQQDFIAAAPTAVTAGVGMSAAFAQQDIAESRGAIEMAQEGMKQFGPNPELIGQGPGLLRTAMGVAIDVAVTGGIASTLAAAVPQFAGAIQGMNTAGNFMNAGQLAGAAKQELQETDFFRSFDEEEGASFAGSIDPLEGGLTATQTNAPMMSAPRGYEAPVNLWRGEEAPPELEALQRQEIAHSEHIADVKHAVQLPPAPAFA